MAYYVAWVKPGSEFNLARRLSGYSPASISTTRPRKKRKPVEIKSPAFPRYVMFPAGSVELAHADRDVAAVLATATGQPFRLDDSEVSRMQELEAAGAFDIQKRKGARPVLNIGDKATITGGVFAGYIGEVLSPSQFDELVQISIQGRKVSVGLAILQKV